MEQLSTWSLWAAAYAVYKGIPLLRVIPGQRCGYVLDNRDGQAEAAIDEWIHGDCQVQGRDLVEVYKELLTRSRNLRSA